jgi:flagellar hook protein FlgE
MALIGTLTSGVSALQSFSKGMEVIGDNIANVNTTAFKGSQAEYADAFGDILRNSASSPSSGNGSDTITMQIGEGVKVDSVKANFGQGTLNPTGVPTDFGISGNGFFQVRDTSGGGTYATRAGNFRVDDQGYLTTTQGYRVQGLSDGGGVFTASVDANGKLNYVLSSTTAPSTVGDLKINLDTTVANGTLVNNTGGAFTNAEIEANAPKINGFGVNSTGDIVLQLSDGETLTRGTVLLQNYQDPNALTRVQGNLYTSLQNANPIGGLTLSATNNTPSKAGNGSIEQGTLELSNVDLTQEFSNLINTQRSFQAGSRVITTADQVLQEIVNLIH